jgi:hypothetical protein
MRIGFVGIGHSAGLQPPATTGRSQDATWFRAFDIVNAAPYVFQEMRSRLRFVALGLVLALACTSEVTLVPALSDDTDTTGTDTTGTDTTVARRATLNLTVRVATSDSAIARQLGWTDGGIPGATVKGFRMGGGQGLDATTDAQGRAAFPGILEGTYRVSVSRLLSAPLGGSSSPRYSRPPGPGVNRTDKGPFWRSTTIPIPRSTWMASSSALGRTSPEMHRSTTAHAP